MAGLEAGPLAAAFLLGIAPGVAIAWASWRKIRNFRAAIATSEAQGDRAAQLAAAAEHATAALKETESRYELALRATNDGVFDVDLTQGRLFASIRLKEICGITDSADLRNIDLWLSLIAAEDIAPVRETVLSLLNGDTDSIRMDFRICRADGSLRWITSQAMAVLEAGRVVRVVGAINDVTDRHRAERQLMHDAVHDKLTGLPNRIQFVAALNEAIEDLSRHGKPLALFHIALDRLRYVNEDLGHAAGDRLLIAVGHRLQSAAGAADVVARLGGDEFAVLVEKIEDDLEIAKIGDYLFRVINAPMELQGRELFLTASVGVAVHHEGERLAEDILADAQLATQKAKEMGKARLQFYEPSLRRAATTAGLLTLGSELHQGVARDEFELHYQPIWRLDEHRLAGFESLMRWRHPRRGLIGPHEFIALSEETGLIERLGRWCVKEACRQLSSWQEELKYAADLFVTVNVSARQLLSSSFVDEVCSALESNGLDASRLKLEVTESLVMADPDLAADMLERFHSRGIRLAIDDFGTGYSSLSYLQRFPFDTLKIDRSFVGRLGRGESDAIVRAIVQLGKGLSMQVIAEGVETAEQEAILKAAGCDMAQGYFFSPPRSADEARGMIEAQG